MVFKELAFKELAELAAEEGTMTQVASRAMSDTESELFAQLTPTLGRRHEIQTTWWRLLRAHRL